MRSSLPNLLALVVLVSLSAACSSSDNGDGGTRTDGGSGTTQDTGGGTCTLSGSCLGAFFETCFDASGTCNATGTTITYASGAALSKTDTTWTAKGSKGDTCYTVDDAAGAYTFHSGGQTLSLTFAGNQARFVCPDGSLVNFTESAFNTSECARFVPTGCAGKAK